MTLWFGPFADLEPDYGYFHLCPACYRKWVKPHFDQVQGRLAELHPAGHQLDGHGRDTSPENPASDHPTAGGRAGTETPDPVAAGGADGADGATVNDAPDPGSSAQGAD